MFKKSPLCLILLLNLLHYITCDELEDDLKQKISILSNLTGSCSEYFQYQLIGDHVYGKLTLPYVEIGDAVKMEFVVKSDNMFSHGIFLPDASSQEIIKRLQKKQPIPYYVGFPLMDDVPELLTIIINEKALCVGQSSNERHLTLQHTLNIRNGVIQVFTKNINIPHFDEATNEPCGLVDREIPIYEGTPLAIGGKLISHGEYPWLVAIYLKSSTGIKFICGGSLVTSKHILSAAHCFEGLSFTPEKITAMLGRHNLTNLSEDGHTASDIESLILHPDYKYGLRFSDADLAILVMKEHVSFTKFIKPICLWSEPADASRNQTGVVVGWGRDGNDNMSTAPMKVNMEIVSDAVCLRSSLAFDVITSPRTLCAGNRDGTGPCEGDSGGALMIKRNRNWMVRGVTSLGLLEDGRCNLDEYTVFCDVAKHMPWLQNNTKQQEALVTGSLKDICGISSSETRFEHPWLAAVYAHFPTGENFICTGLIVSSRSVLLPDGCFVNNMILQFHRFRVYPGRYDLSNMNERGAVLRKVESLIFIGEPIGVGNVALLQMKDPVSFTQYIKPICLWSASRDESQNLEQNVALTGWTFDDVHNKITMVPTSTEIIVPVGNCTLEMRPTSCIALGKVRRDSADLIRMMKRNGRWMLLGGCKFNTTEGESETYCTLNYTDMAATMSWIRRNMLS